MGGGQLRRAHRGLGHRGHRGAEERGLRPRVREAGADLPQGEQLRGFRQDRHHGGGQRSHHPRAEGLRAAHLQRDPLHLPNHRRHGFRRRGDGSGGCEDPGED